MIRIYANDKEVEKIKNSVILKTRRDINYNGNSIGFVVCIRIFGIPIYKKVILERKY